MLPLMRIADTLALVCSDDPSVTHDGDPDTPVWLEAETATYTNDALVCTVRPMRSSEVLRFQGSDESHIALYAARLCTVRIKGPGLDVSDQAALRELLDRIRPSQLAALGGKVIEASLLPSDPTAATASES